MKNDHKPLLLGYDDGNGKYEPVLEVFERGSNGSYIFVRNFFGDEAEEVYENLTKKEVD